MFCFIAAFFHDAKLVALNWKACMYAQKVERFLDAFGWIFKKTFTVIYRPCTHTHTRDNYRHFSSALVLEWEEICRSLTQEEVVSHRKKLVLQRLVSGKNGTGIWVVCIWDEAIECFYTHQKFIIFILTH